MEKINEKEIGYFTEIISKLPADENCVLFFPINIEEEKIEECSVELVKISINKKEGFNSNVNYGLVAGSDKISISIFNESSVIKLDLRKFISLMKNKKQIENIDSLKNLECFILRKESIAYSF